MQQVKIRPNRYDIYNLQLVASFVKFTAKWSLRRPASFLDSHMAGLYLVYDRRISL